MDARTILIVEGKRTAEDGLADALARAGYIVRRTASGEEALEMARADPPHLVVLDLVLPDMSGYLVCRALRDEFGETVPVVLLSGERTDRLDRTAGLLIGAHDCLARPVDLAELLARIRRLIRQAPGAGRNGTRNGTAHHLTRRELDVLRLVAQGREVHEIGAILGTRPGMVERHLQRLLSKLGVDRSAEAIAWARRTHLLSLGTQFFATSLLDGVGVI